MKKIIFYTLISLINILIFLIFISFIGLLFENKNKIKQTELPTPFENFSNFKKFRPGTHFNSIYGLNYKINKNGYRSSEDYFIQKPKDTYRIICIGASSTAGLEVLEDFTWPVLLENKINSNFTNIEVLNFGVSSSTISDHYNQLKKDVVKYNPDLVIYYEGFNDTFGYISNYYKIGTNYFDFLKRFYISQFLKVQFLLKKNFNIFISNKLRKNYIKKYYTNQLENILLLAKEYNFEFIIVQQALNYKLLELNNYDELYKKLNLNNQFWSIYFTQDIQYEIQKKISLKYDKKFIETNKIFIEKNKEINLFQDTTDGVVHLTEKGNNLLSDIIYNNIYYLISDFKKN